MPAVAARVWHGSATCSASAAPSRRRSAGECCHGGTLGLRPKVHADQLAWTGGAELAAELGAVSAEHLDYVSPAGIEAMAAAGVTAVLLPGAVVFLGRSRFAPAARLLEAGVRVALSTDFNPGTCYSENLWLMGSIASSYMKMEVTDVIRAMTVEAARALAMEAEVGSLEPGRRGDLLVLDAQKHQADPVSPGGEPGAGGGEGWACGRGGVIRQPLSRGEPMKLVECVPNVSEGRDPATVEAIAAAVRATPGVILLGVSSDPDHNRSVISYLGEPEAVLAATVALCLEAFDRIDMRAHTGCHPRLGSVDVVPFVPLGGVTTEEAVALARRLGERLGAEGIPVYYYEDAALLPERRNLADVRRGEYEGLQERLATVGGRPDAGPSTFNARAGACIVGVRKPLIAFNVNLATDRLEVADAIARAVRLSSGGYRGVKALGVALPAKGQVQVSMNLVDYQEHAHPPRGGDHPL